MVTYVTTFWGRYGLFEQDNKKTSKSLKASSTRRKFRFKTSHRSNIDVNKPPKGAKTTTKTKK